MKAQKSSYLKRLHPSRLFKPVPDLLIERAQPKSLAFGSAAKPKPLHSESIKVLSWNIARSNYSRHWVRDCQTIVEQQQPDLVFLQEVRLSDQNEKISELTEMDWSFAPNFMNARDASYSGILVAAKAERLSSRVLLSEYREPVSSTPKISLIVEYSLLGSSKRLLAVNIHAINFVDLNKFKHQLQAIELILMQHPGAIVFAGDFNTWSRARSLALFAMADRLILKKVEFPAAESRHLKRFLLSPPLDYIFYRGFKQKPSSARVIDTPTSSDHNPLFVELCGW